VALSSDASPRHTGGRNSFAGQGVGRAQRPGMGTLSGWQTNKKQKLQWHGDAVAIPSAVPKNAEEMPFFGARD
jgi:hypothetical protein